MKLSWLIVGLFVLFFVVALTKKKGRSRYTSGIPPTARPPLTRREQELFLILCSAFPAPRFFVLSQVAFSALLTSRDQSVRNGFNRKVADFVLCDGDLKVIAVIELDDSSHAGREDKDDARDSLLTGAGYRVQRYQRMPDMARLRSGLPPVSRTHSMT